MFCPNCGQALAPLDQKTAIDAYVAARVEQELKLRTKDDDAVVRDVAFRAENEAISRLKRYWWIGALVISLGGILLAFVGIASIQDAKRTIVAEARQRVEPVIGDVEKRAQAAQANLFDVEKRLPAVMKSLNETEALADSQRQRIEGQSAEINSKISGFQAAAKRATDLSDGFEANMAASQRRLDELTRTYDTQMDRISKGVAHTSISAAFPLLEQEPFIGIGSARLDRLEKKAGEKWIDLYVDNFATKKHAITQDALESIVSRLETIGFTVFSGAIVIGGRSQTVVFRAGPGAPGASGLFYFHPGFRQDAERILAVCKGYFSIPSNSPQLVEKGTVVSEPEGVDFIRRDGKLDAQIYISAPQ